VGREGQHEQIGKRLKEASEETKRRDTRTLGDLVCAIDEVSEICKEANETLSAWERKRIGSGTHHREAPELSCPSS
jgi:hypothetical protein